jgi:hypothetical protein
VRAIAAEHAREIPAREERHHRHQRKGLCMAGMPPCIAADRVDESSRLANRRAYIGPTHGRATLLPVFAGNSLEVTRAPFEGLFSC